MKLTVYGSRGSIPFFSRESAGYGGNTSCFKLETPGNTVIFDCGSGLLQYDKELAGRTEPVKIDILLSHLHLDHTIGLTMFRPLFAPDSHIRVFTKSRDGRPLREQIFGSFAPPYWPLDFSALARAECVAVGSEPFYLNGGARVSTLAAEHPDGTLSYRVDAMGADGRAGKSFVYLLDYEVRHKPELYGPLVEFVRDADCMVFDSCYLPADYPAKADWGHSTYEAGLRLARDANCKMTVLAHWSHDYNDAALNGVGEIVKKSDVLCRVAYDGMQVEL